MPRYWFDDLANFADIHCALGVLMSFSKLSRPINFHQQFF
jgi:hypothetical protein